MVFHSFELQIKKKRKKKEKVIKYTKKQNILTNGATVSTPVST